jgi:membrane protein DedA with SNARE-associated domain
MDSITGPIVEWATNLIGSWGVLAVFALMVLESACIPVPSEAIMLFAGFAVTKGDMSLWAAVAAGVAGNLVGSWIAYAIGLYGGRPFVDRWGKYVLMSHHKLDVAERWFAEYGAPAVFFSRMLPIVRTFISLPAGMARMPFWKFTLYTAAGCIPWVLMLGLIGVAVGDNWAVIEGYMKYFDYFVAACIIGFIAWAIVRWARRRSRPGNGGASHNDGTPDPGSPDPSPAFSNTKGEQQ